MNRHLSFRTLPPGALSGAREQTADTSVNDPVIQPETDIYRRIGTTSLKAYVFQPKTAGKTHPAVLLFHGGAWRLGEAAWTFDRAREFAKKGMVAISIDYRLSNEGRSPIEAVEDACTAFTWTRRQAKRFRIDPKRVAGYGVSAGGHLAAATATLPAVNGKKISDSSRPNALLLFSPALDMAQDDYFKDLMQGKGNPAHYSPAEYISRNLPPTLIIQGEKDTIVRTSHAIAFRDAARKAGALCTLQVYPGVGHLLTRNLNVQYRDFDPDPKNIADAFQRENAFLVSLGYIKK